MRSPRPWGPRGVVECTPGFDVRLGKALWAATPGRSCGSPASCPDFPEATFSTGREVTFSTFYERRNQDREKGRQEPQESTLARGDRLGAGSELLPEPRPWAQQ